jgi:hypothetical protein
MSLGLLTRLTYLRDHKDLYAKLYAENCSIWHIVIIFTKHTSSMQLRLEAFVEMAVLQVSRRQNKY